MKKLIAKFEPIDIIAIVVIVSCIGLVALNKDGLITSILLTITGFYFGRKSK